MSFEYKSIYLDKPFISGRELEIFVPKKIICNISMIFIHGGGWAQGNPKQMHKIMEGFLDKGFICASLGYRLVGTPEIDVFVQLTDLRHAYDRFISFLKKQGCPLKIVTYGSSAGAHLNALMSLTIPGECGEKLEFNALKLRNDWVRPIGSLFQSIPVLFEPWEDIFPGIWNSMIKAAGVSWEEHPEIYKRLAPIEYINSETQPLFFLNASNEHMFPACYVEKAAEKLRSYGTACTVNNYENAEHGFFYDLTRNCQRMAFVDVLNFIEIISG